MSFYRTCFGGLCLLVIVEGCTSHQHQSKFGAQSFQQTSALPSSQPSRLPLLPREQSNKLYVNFCSTCHGVDGRANTDLARDLNPPPMDFYQCNFKYRSTPSGSLPLSDDLLRTLYVGIPGSAMPSFAALLSFSSLSSLTREVQERCDRFGREEPDPPLHVPPPTLYQPSSVAQGQAIYVREKCASCHGETGRGNGPAANTLKDVLGRSIQPRDYTQGIFRSGFRRDDIYRAFSTGLDGTPMPALPDMVNAQDRWHLTNYIVSFSYQRHRVWRAAEIAPSWYEPIRAWRLPWR